jgi:predicted nuclease of restriction endonuclease-like (RecB) superfamily
LIENLSARLITRYGRGHSISNLRNFREFYLAYPNRLGKIRYPVGSESALPNRQQGIQYPAGSESRVGFHPNLSWSHYRALMRVEKPEARDFYEKEAALTGWSKRELERQVGSLYYERLLMSRSKRAMLAENRNPTVAAHPLEVIKGPYVLESLGLPEDHQMNETELEEQLITHMQAFLLELGQGFAFIRRQQRLTLD